MSSTRFDIDSIYNSWEPNNDGPKSKSEQVLGGPRDVKRENCKIRYKHEEVQRYEEFENQGDATDMQSSPLSLPTNDRS